MEQEEWWSGGPSWVEYAKQEGAHRCICPACDGDHEPDQGGYYASMRQRESELGDDEPCLQDITDVDDEDPQNDDAEVPTAHERGRVHTA